MMQKIMQLLVSLVDDAWRNHLIESTNASSTVHQVVTLTINNNTAHSNIL